MDLTMKCPCGTGLSFQQCCMPFHDGALAPTPVALMRSRYSAFALGNVEYLKRSWSASTRPNNLELDPTQVWTRLRILEAPDASEDRGVVHFRAHYRYGTERDFLEERSRFERVGGAWLYVDGDILDV